MERQKVGPCPKCGGHSQFYHVVGDVTQGYCMCEMCGRKQNKVQDREVAVAKWNGVVAPRMKRIWDNYKVISEVRKSDSIKFVIAAATREGFRYINIREFYLRKTDGEWKPGRDGITIPLVAPLNKGEQFIKPYEDLLVALKEAMNEANTMELMDEANAVWAETKQRKE